MNNYPKRCVEIATQLASGEIDVEEGATQILVLLHMRSRDDLLSVAKTMGVPTEFLDELQKRVQP